MLVNEISVQCEGEGCGKLLDLRVESTFDARDTAKHQGWRMRLVDHMQKDFCPECLKKMGIKTHTLFDWSTINPLVAERAIPTLERIRRST